MVSLSANREGRARYPELPHHDQIAIGTAREGRDAPTIAHGVAHIDPGDHKLERRYHGCRPGEAGNISSHSEHADPAARAPPSSTTTIDPEGPVLRVIDTENRGRPPRG